MYIEVTNQAAASAVQANLAQMEVANQNDATLVELSVARGGVCWLHRPCI